MARFCILLGGDLHATPQLMADLVDCRVIAADSGIAHAETLGITPELWVGDFDSATVEQQERWSNVERAGFDVEKDMTDGDLAIREALRRGADRFLLVGAFGGLRFDHAFQIVTATISLAEAGLETLMTDGRQYGRALLPGRTQLEVSEGTLFSVLAFTELEGLTIENAKWPLAEANIPFGSSETMSNVARGTVDLGLKSGRALVLATLALPTG